MRTRRFKKKAIVPLFVKENSLLKEKSHDLDHENAHLTKVKEIKFA